MKIKRFDLILLGSLTLSAFLLSGCSLVAQPADVSSERPIERLSGTINKVQGKFYLTDEGKKIELDSNKLDLTDYLSRPVEVEGEYSGATLFVDRVR